MVLLAVLIWGASSYKALQQRLKEKHEANLQLEKDLDIAKRSAKVAYQAKKEFLSNMSHESGRH